MIRKFGFILCLCLLPLSQALGAQDSTSAATRCHELMDDRQDLYGYGNTPVVKIAENPELLEKALRVCRQAHEADPENLEILRFLGLAVLTDERTNDRPVTGLHYIIEAAEGGDVMSQFYLAKIYSHGVFGEVDADKAFQWYRRAAENGHPEAQSQVAEAFLSGVGTEQDIDKGVADLERLAAEGNVYAHTLLGALLLEGRFVPKDKARGVQHLEIAAAADEPIALTALGSHLMMEGLLRRPDGESREIPLGNEEAIKVGAARAQELIASDTWQLDSESRKTVLRGVDLLKKAAERGNKLAALNLLEFYRFEETLNLGDPEKAAQSRSQYAYWVCKSGEIGRELAPEIAAKCPD